MMNKLFKLNINFYYNKISSLQSKDIDRRSLLDFVRISSDFVGNE